MRTLEWYYQRHLDGRIQWIQMRWWQHWQECEATLHASGQTNTKSSLLQCFAGKIQLSNNRRTATKWRWLVTAGTELCYFPFSCDCRVHPDIWWSKKIVHTRTPNMLHLKPWRSQSVNIIVGSTCEQQTEVNSIHYYHYRLSMPAAMYY